MPKLLKNINVDIIPFNEGEIVEVGTATAESGMDSYITIFGLIALLVDLSKASTLTELEQPPNFGLYTGLELQKLTVNY